MMAIAIHRPCDSRTALIAAIAPPRTRGSAYDQQPTDNYVRVGAGDAVKDRVVLER
ncbi:MAG: hypothetical protein QOJ51_1575 [Acidobacteriaceae bacterium]|jgi:hypothetical protein|nr:hypothetical protein [Acidobacteriaceae bacterium]